jgi:hypothetical protein
MRKRQEGFRYIFRVFISLVLVLINLIVVLGQVEEEVKKKEVDAQRLLGQAKELYYGSVTADKEKKHAAYQKLLEAFEILKGCENPKDAMLCVDMGKLFDEQNPTDGSSIEFYKHAIKVFDKLELYFEEAKVYRLIAEKCHLVKSGKHDDFYNSSARDDYYDSFRYKSKAEELEQLCFENHPNVESLFLVKKIYIDPIAKKDKWSKEFEAILKNKIVNILNIVEFREDQSDAVLQTEKEKDLCLINRKGKVLWRFKNFRYQKKPNLMAEHVINDLVSNINKQKNN